MLCICGDGLVPCQTNKKKKIKKINQLEFQLILITNSLKSLQYVEEKVRLDINNQKINELQEIDLGTSVTDTFDVLICATNDSPDEGTNL